ncbi:MAG: response regulator, partial [Nitrospirota bacterium]
MDRLKTEFFANISHEFRTPITLTLGPIEQMLKGRQGIISDPIREELVIMERNQERLLRLVNQILDLTKLEAGSMGLKAAPMPDMNQFVRERLENFCSLAEKRGLQLIASLDPQVYGAELYIDREMFDKLLLNLLSNALKFTKEGYVEISTGIHEGVFCLVVKDTGIGIKKHQLAYVFDRFRQADGNEGAEQAGTGIGLALVKEITKLHGGEVRVQSEYGEGSLFEVLIPLGKEHLDPVSVVEVAGESLKTFAGSKKLLFIDETGLDQEDAEQDNQEAEASFDPNKPTVLYVEDNQDLRNHLRSLLSPHYNVFLGIDGHDGLEKAIKYTPDLILSDQMMPHMSGRGLLRMLRMDPQLSSTPVIFLTALSETESRVAALDAGADDYLSKPFDESELLARVRNLLRARAQEKELAELNRRLEVRIEEQMAELVRSGELRRFLPQTVVE